MQRLGFLLFFFFFWAVSHPLRGLDKMAHYTGLWRASSRAFLIILFTGSFNLVAALQAPLSSASTPLFEWETQQLTSEILEGLSKSEGVWEHAALFGFDDGSEKSLPASGSCRCFPGEDSWPGREVWDAFNQALRGALIPTVPIGAPCFRDWDLYSEDECAAIKANWTNGYFQYELLPYSSRPSFR